MKGLNKYEWLALILLGAFIAAVFISMCEGCTINKVVSNQYPCDTDSLGNKLQNVNIYLDNQKQNPKK